MLLRSVLIAAALGAMTAWAMSATTTGRATPDAITVDGGSYYGPLLDGRLHGEGRVEWPSGERYQGGFAFGRYHGHGIRTDSSGRRYAGQFAHGLFEGKGRYESPDGEVYEGQFVNDQFTGQGRYTSKDGSEYVGHFVDWRFDGQGRLRNATGVQYEGSFHRGQLAAKGTIISPDGARYTGEVRNWLPHGEGNLLLPNGDVYTGTFEHGSYHGRGTLTYAVAQNDGRTRDEGQWRYGELDDPLAEQLVQRNAESALYRQHELLERTIAALTPRTPGQINLYLLSVGGDGSQEVFRREVDFVGAQFASQYGAQGHTLSLVNSRHTGATHPMATLTSIEQSLQALATRMDRQQDILFLFLTSHGSEDHQLTLDQAGMPLRDLPATDLHRLLQQTGIRWKVIVVSACYSGGFIDALKDDNTLIITAARRDRQSFGCSDDNDFTYFGRAFFKEALPVSDSFQSAFQRAQQLVSAWERKDIEGRGEVPEAEYSYPQMHNPAPVERHLRDWWAQRRAGLAQVTGPASPLVTRR